MNVTRVLYIVMGAFVFISALLGFFHSKYWLIFTMFVGLNVFQFGFTGFCPMGVVLKKLGVPESSQDRGKKAAGWGCDC